MTLYDPALALEQVAAGLKQVALDPIPALNGYDYPPGTPILPAGIVMPPEINYRQTMRAGVITLEFEIHLLVTTAAGHEGSKSLWQYLNWGGPESLLALIDANPALGIVGVDGAPRVHAHVAAARPLGLDEMPPLESWAFGAAIAVPVHVTNKE